MQPEPHPHFDKSALLLEPVTSRRKDHTNKKMLRRTAGEVLKKSPNDVVVLSAVRSPIARAFKGGFKDSYPEEILMPVSCFAIIAC